MKIGESGNVPLQKPPVRFLLEFDDLQNGIGDLGDIPGDIAHDDLGKAFPVPGVQVPHHAEIEGADHVAGQDEHVARVGISMKKPVDEDLLQDKLRSPGRQQGAVAALSLQKSDIVDLDSLDVFHGEEPLRRGMAEDPGDVNGGVAPELPGEAFRMGGLQVEVDLLADCPGKLLDDPRGAIEAEFFNIPFQQAGQLEEYAQIFADGLGDPRTLDLDRHVLAGDQPGPVHLGNGGSGDRNFLKGGKDLLQRLLELLFDDDLRLGKGKGRNIVLELGQFLHHFDGDQVGAGGKNLSHLHEGRPQFFADQADPFVIVQGFDFFLLPPGQEAHPHLDVTAEIQPVDDPVKTVFEQYRQDLPVAVDVAVGAGNAAQAAKSHKLSLYMLFLTT